MRTQNTQKEQTIFLHTPPLPPPQCLSISETSLNQPEPARIDHNYPRLETAWPDTVQSFGDELGAFALEFAGIDLLPWQRRVLIGQLMHDGNWDHPQGPALLNRVSLCSVARQNGKTTALMVLIAWYLIEVPKLRGKPITVLSTAHRLDLAVMLFDELGPILEKKYGAHLVRSYGRNQVIMPDGSKWFVRAANPSVGHGMQNLALIVADEIWDISREAIDGGLLPAQRAQRSPLLSMWSTAGTENSLAMLRWREQGLRMIDEKKTGNFYFAEWSPPPHVSPMTPEAWEYGNPALGYFLTPETILAESQNPDRAQFLRSSCNLWVASDKGWISPGLWPELEYDGEIPAGGVCVLETSLDDTRYFCVRGVSLPDRKTLITVEFMVDTFAQALVEIERLAKDPSIKFAITPTVDVHWPLHLERRRIVWGYGELLKYTPVAKNMITEKLLLHTGEQMLAEHCQRAVAVRTQGSMVLSSQRSPGPIELARCLVTAACLASRPQVTGKPMVVSAGR